MRQQSKRYRVRSLLVGLVGLLLILAACAPSSASSSSLPKGWTSYHDTRFPFQLPVPPGWHAGAFSDGPLNDETCAWVVGILTPNQPEPPDKGALKYANEVISITVNISCREWQPSGDTHFVPEAHPITISGATATLYDGDVPGYSIQRAAVTRFGGHQYRFFLQADTSGPHMSDAMAQHDLALYMQVLRGFTYQGT